MKTLTSIAILFSAFLSISAYAQIKGAVSFDKDTIVSEPKEAATEQISVEQQQPKKATDQQAKLKERLEKSGIFENPRITKKVYAALQGTQQAIEKEQKEAMKNKTFETPEEKAAYEQKLKERALMHFKDFEGDAQTINKQINERPVEKIQEMINNINYIDPEKLSNDDSQAIRDEANSIFEAKEGLSAEEYMHLYEQQLEDNANQTIPPEQLDKNSRIVNGAEIEVKKIDDKTAVIQPKASK